MKRKLDEENINNSKYTAVQALNPVYVHRLTQGCTLYRVKVYTAKLSELKASGRVPTRAYFNELSGLKPLAQLRTDPLPVEVTVVCAYRPTLCVVRCARRPTLCVHTSGSPLCVCASPLSDSLAPSLTLCPPL